MAKGDPTSGAVGAGGQAAQNPKMDQYSVMHHLMQQLSGGGQQGNQNGFGSAIGSMAPSIGALMGGMGGMQKPSYGNQSVYGDQLQQAMGQGQDQQQVANYAAPNQMNSGYGMQRNQQMPQMAGPRQMFSRSGIGPMMSNMGMQGSLAPQNRFRQQLNQQPATDTNPQQV